MDGQYRALPLNPLRAFAVASRHRSFTAAANYMGVSQVAISRQISTLENYLGVKLFDRDARSVKLTEAGRAFSQEISGLFDDLEAATKRVRERQNDFTVNLRVYPTFAHYWLMPRLQGFMEQYPDFRIQLETTVEPLDFRGTHLDVAIQLGHGVWRDSKCRELFPEIVDIVCSPSYAEGLTTRGNGRTLESSRLLHAKYRRREWEIISRVSGFSVDRLEGMEFESSLLLYKAAQEGFGLAIGQLELIADEIRSGTLVRPFNLSVDTGAAFYVVWPTLKSVSPPARRFVDWILGRLDRKPEFFKYS